MPQYTQPVSGMPANGTLEFAIECAKMKAVEDAQRAALSTAKLKASQLHQVALLETAQRRNDIAAVSKNIATGVATLSAKPVTSYTINSTLHPGSPSTF